MWARRSARRRGAGRTAQAGKADDRRGCRAAGDAPADAEGHERGRADNGHVGEQPRERGQPEPLDPEPDVRLVVVLGHLLAQPSRRVAAAPPPSLRRPRRALLGRLRAALLPAAEPPKHAGLIDAGARRWAQSVVEKHAAGAAAEHGGAAGRQRDRARAEARGNCAQARRPRGLASVPRVSNVIESGLRRETQAVETQAGGKAHRRCRGCAPSRR